MCKVCEAVRRKLLKWKRISDERIKQLLDRQRNTSGTNRD